MGGMELGGEGGEGLNCAPGAPGDIRMRATAANFSF